MKGMILFMILISSIVLSSDFYYNNGEKISIEKIDNFIGIKTKDIETKESFKKMLNLLDIPKLEGIKKSSNNRFLLKFSEKIDKKEFLKLNNVEYTLPAYQLEEYSDDNLWPLFIDKQIVVKFKKGVSQEYIKDVLNSFNLTPRDKSYDIKSYIVVDTTEDSSNIIDIANELYLVNGVEYSYPDFMIEFIKLHTPNDTYFPRQWHHGPSTGGVKSEAAWDISKGSSSIKIAIVDDGYDLIHEDLTYFKTRNFNTELESKGEHGIACGGVAAATGDNGKGMVGICPHCSLIGAKFMGDGYAPITASSDAIKWAVFVGADVINNSWGARTAIRRDEAMNDVIEYAVTVGRSGKGVVILFASGNDNREFYDYEYAGHPDVLAIGASDYQDNRSIYSSYGDSLDVVAPSSSGRYQSEKDNIFTTDRTGAFGYNQNGYLFQEGQRVARDLPNDDYTQFFGGTSSAAPLVSGLAGLILSKAPNLTYKQVFDIIRSTATKIGNGYDSNGHSQMFGYGKVNAFKALQKAELLSTCTPAEGGEICDNNIDDDCDSKIDNDDSDCDDSEPCNAYTCREHSTCIADKKTYSITCPCNDGYEEKNGKCSLILTCRIVNCSFHGVCEEAYGKLQCVCEKGYHPKETECLKDDLCTYSVCKENSTCFVEDGECYCDKGYFMRDGECVKFSPGSKCEDIYCLPNSTCNEENALCECDGGYTAKNGACEKNPDNASCNYSNNSNNSLFFFFIFLIFVIFRRKSSKE